MRALRRGEARIRAAHRACRHRRRLGRRRRDRGADTIRRCRGGGGAATFSFASARDRAPLRSTPKPPTFRPAAVSSCSRSASTARASSTIRATSISSSSTIRGRAAHPGGRRAGAALRALTQGARAPAAGAHERRLCAARRPAAAARSRPRRRSRSRCRAPSPITRRSARTGSAPRSSRRGPSPATSRSARDFLAELAPFIWRKYFDYAAIADIHAMKRQIHAVRGHEEVVVSPATT